MNKMKKRIGLFLFALLLSLGVFCQGRHYTNNPEVHESNNTFLVEFLFKKIRLTVYEIEYQQFDFGNTKLTALVIPGKKDNENMRTKLNRLFVKNPGVEIMYDWEKADQNMYTMIIVINDSTVVFVTHKENTIYGNLLLLQTQLEYDKI